MTNLERYILELKKKHYPVWWDCKQCPAKKYCDDVENIVEGSTIVTKHCLQIWEEWMNTEADY